MTKSINEPEGSRVVMYQPTSLNEPITLQAWLADTGLGGDAEIPPIPGAATITGLEPAEAPAGSSVELVVYCIGHNEKKSYIYFGDAEMRTQLATQTSISTVIPQNEMISPRLVNVTVRREGLVSNQMSFSVTPYERGISDPDELEDEIEQAEDEGEFKSTHRVKAKTKR
jgi:hypothetical protein